jgi:DNA-3-methyladenine glycosylase II
LLLSGAADLPGIQAHVAGVGEHLLERQPRPVQAPGTLARLDRDLPGRKGEYLQAVAEAALDGLLAGAALRAVDPEDAIQRVQQVKGLGPFAAELIVVRGANAPDALPHHERRLDAEIAERYGPGRTLADVSQAWRSYRTWAAVHLRALREQRTGEISGR